ncbi:MAG: SpoIIE family protein phosphatase [Candidatus Methanomethylophilaceae archaeon]|nr:SpoIIE family protein phosphatase [Candidatus Methanomethylophilaceae archaeon]
MTASKMDDMMREAMADEDHNANRMVAYLIVAFIATHLLWLLVGEVSIRGIPVSQYYLFASMAQLGLSLVIYRCLGDRWWMGYLLVGSMVLSCFLITAGIDYSMMIIMSFPTVASSVYCRRRFTLVVTVVGSFLMLAGLLINDHYSSVMLGFYYGMTAMERYINILKVHFVADFLLYVLISLTGMVVAQIGIRNVEVRARLQANKMAFEADLNTAKGIQSGILPKEFPLGDNCDVSASVSPAKEVGGDFYDCFRVGDGRIAIVMADVSGKGLPASLFMATSITLLRSNIGNTRELDKAMERTNRELAASNQMKYFVTVWAGILDLCTGDLTYVNAGHNPPYLDRGEGYRKLESKPDFVLGRKKGIRYTARHLVIRPGDTLFLYTDGVTEAMDGQGAFFGDQRLLSALDSVRAGSVKETVTGISDILAAFVGDAPQSDDVTMMAVRYTKPLVPHTDEGITVRADHEGYGKVIAHLESRLSEVGCPNRVQSEMKTACSEIFSNIDRYAYDGFPEKGDVHFSVDVIESTVRVRFADEGVEFNPLEHEDPDPGDNFKKRIRGGLGIMLVRKICDDVAYVRENGQNVLILEKEIR